MLIKLPFFEEQATAVSLVTDLHQITGVTIDVTCRATPALNCLLLQIINE